MVEQRFMNEADELLFGGEIPLFGPPDTLTQDQLDERVNEIAKALANTETRVREQEVEPLREAAQKMADGIAKLRKVWQEEGDFRVESRGLHVDITVGDALMAMDEGESAFRALLAGGEGGGE